MGLFFSGSESPFDPQTGLENLLASPLKFSVSNIYQILLWLRGPAYHPPLHQKLVRVVCLSDTHCHTLDHVPQGDVLIHAGDLTNAGTVEELQTQLDWLQSLPHQEKIIIAGNHDSFFDPKSRVRGDKGKKLNFGCINYLRGNTISLKFPSHNNRSLNVHGSPQIPICGGKEFAFQHLRQDDTWSETIPMDTDVLVTHTPPKYHLDLPAGLGDEHLLKEVWRVRPTLHVFGHVHAGAGRQAVFWDEGQKAYERVAARKGSFFADFFSPSTLLNAAKVLLYGIRGVVWSRIWGGHVQGGWMINAALIYRSTGKIGNPVQVVDI
jgi:predicted phosphohydrolase